jgi:hypothetical protein
MVDLLPGSDQPADDRLNAVARQALRLFTTLTGEGMVDHHHGVLGQPQDLGPDACRLGECLCDNGDGGAAPFFDFDAIVETPRSAGPSIGDRVDDRITGAGQLVQDRVGRWHALTDFPVRDHLRHAITVLQHVA